MSPKVLRQLFRSRAVTFVAFHPFKFCRNSSKTSALRAGREKLPPLFDLPTEINKTAENSTQCAEDIEEFGRGKKLYLWGKAGVCGGA
jgi:hypothetical protein